MGYNAIVCGKEVNTKAVENIDSTNKALHVTDPFDLGLIGNVNYGPTNRIRGFTFGRKSVVNNTLVSMLNGPTGNHFCQIRLAATCHDDLLLPDTMIVQDEVGTQNGGANISFPTPIPIPQKTDVSLFAISDGVSANVIAMGSIMGFFETNI